MMLDQTLLFQVYIQTLQRILFCFDLQSCTILTAFQLDAFLVQPCTFCLPFQTYFSTTLNTSRSSIQNLIQYSPVLTASHLDPIFVPPCTYRLPLRLYFCTVLYLLPPIKTLFLYRPVLTASHLDLCSWNCDFKVLTFLWVFAKVKVSCSSNSDILC